MSAAVIASELEKARVIAIIRLPQAEGLLDAVRAVAAGGVRALEVTLTVPGAVEQIQAIRHEFPELLLGAGTVTTAEEVRAVEAAGATYIVSPILRPSLISQAKDLGLVSLPGCQTPTEMWQAHQAGAEFVKLFPAAHLPPSYIKDIRAPLPELKIVPTGGIGVENVRDWLDAGAAAVGVGSALVDGRLVKARDFQTIEKRARALASAAL
ncbi:MAG: bifunctional 4-hydroxy-2-oxoglutarate aldolase/2-dehydro-3-deoxy-phosphogluconate aldolase [Polyangiaceae bacterium]|nr:bifunctional 4-hydroxy-2-oxoglutarate aldolase/2-dehydro-3-deoxy-phosphogluconate aldolase [Polyangiaceae bacterium]